MIGIVSYGAYIPRYRTSRAVIASAMGWLRKGALPGEKSVANYDEDSITMSVAAGIDCLRGIDRKSLEGLYLATTTPPYKARQDAGIVATALDLSSEIRTSDFTDSVKAGTAGLLSACDAVKAGSVKNLLVCAADCRLGKPASLQEQAYGDGAAAFLIGDDDVIASIEGSFSVSYDFMDSWRAENDSYDHYSEDRWIQDEGYSRFITEAVYGLLKKYDLSLEHISKIVFPCLYPREHAAIGKRMGAKPEQIQPEILTTVGDTGAAHPLMMLVAALEDSLPGDNIIVASYGNGSDALFFRVTENIAQLKGRRGMAKHLNSKSELSSYERYLNYRNVISVEKGPRGEVGSTQVPLLWRERKSILALCGSKCKSCGTPQYPPQRVCANPACGAIDSMEEYRFSDRPGRLFTYTGDSLAFTPSPPAIYGMVDFEGGGRYLFDLTDCELDSLEIDMHVEMSLRRKYVDEVHGIHGYFWKAIPVREIE